MKQTAVEWLYKELIDFGYYSLTLEILYDQAKEMEKQQIIDAYDLGMGHYGDANCKYDAEEYYNKTFKNK